MIGKKEVVEEEVGDESIRRHLYGERKERDSVH